MKKFSQLEISSIKDSTVILDVDGTLVLDNSLDVPEKSKHLIEDLSLSNKVYLCSNRSHSSLEKFARMINVDWINSIKPFKNGIKDEILSSKNKIVVGDKYLTDGLFALNIGAKFIKVTRLEGPTDSLFIKLTYIVDDFVWTLKNYLALMRPWQWVKNLLVIAPVFFAGQFFSLNTFFQSILAFMVFSVFASSAYIFNDISDAESDKNHDVKKHRAIASGLISKKEAMFLSLCLLVFGVYCLKFVPSILPIMSMYVAVNVLYTLFFKTIPILDALFIAFCYVLRILSGGFAAEVYISPWIISCVFFGSLFVIFGKRLAEFNHGKGRAVLRLYSHKSLKILLFLSLASVLIVYTIWSILEHDSAYLVFSTFFVALALLRMSHLINKGSSLGEYPELLVFKDKVILFSFVIWLTYVALIFYF